VFCLLVAALVETAGVAVTFAAAAAAALLTQIALAWTSTHSVKVSSA
jgi:hypothetical protein